MVKKQSNQKKTKTVVAETINDENIISADTKPLIDNDKALVDESIDAQDNLLGTGESFSYNTTTTKRKPSTTSVYVDPFEKSKVLAVMEGFFITKQSLDGIKALKTRESRILSGTLVGEFIASLNELVPDNYQPKGRNKRNIKTDKPSTWKLSAINEPNIRDRLKQWLASGDILVFKIERNQFIYCLTRTFMSMDKYVGSVWHLNQIKTHLYGSAQWDDKSEKKGYRNIFIDKPFFKGFIIDDFETILALDEKAIFECWTDKGWDYKALNDLINQVYILSDPEKTES